MIRILTLPTGFLAANCYIVIDDLLPGKPCAVIDPGSEPERIIQTVRAENASVKSVFITHGHYDHVGAIAGVVAEFKCPVFMAGDDQKLYDGQSDFIESIGGDVHDSFEYFMDEKTYLLTDDLEFSVHFTPGHSAGGVCLALQSVKALFTGDTLFEGTIGRTDLPGSDPEVMKKSLQKIMAHFKDYMVYPGHGEATTMQKEIQTNPFLRRLSSSNA